jgi:hypothetical protein
LDLFLLHRYQLHPLLFAQRVDLLMQCQDFQLGFQVDFVIVFGGHPVFGRIAVLGHHNDRGLQSSQHGQDEIEKNLGIRIEGFAPPRQNYGIEHDPQKEHGNEKENECPGTTEYGDAVGEALSESQGLFIFSVDVAADVKALRQAFDDALFIFARLFAGLPELCC